MHRTNLICAIVSLWLFLTIQYIQCSRPTIRQTVNGPIEGVEMITSFGEIFYAFKSIPYAKTPITGIDPHTGEMADRRFKAPESIDRHWNEPLPVNTYGKQCMQGRFGDVHKFSEDCLHLNVYVPSGGAKRKTVLVYIHGGSFAYGGGPVGPDFLLSQDNIVINIQYRVGMFGFLNLNYGEYTGNMGLKDQQMALKWIYENIEYFSGNKDEILLIGQSAGGASVHFHMLNEQSRKYFTRAYPISSSAFSFYALVKENHIQKLQNCSKFQEMDKMIEYIKTSDANTLRQCYPYKFPGKLHPVWVPTIESPNNVKAFMTKTPEEMYRLGMAPTMDVMFSFDSHEMIAFFQELLEIKEPLLKEDWTQYNEEIFQLPFENVTRSTHPNEHKYAIEKLRASYYSNATTVQAIKAANIDLSSDLTFSYGILKGVIAQANANTNGRNKNQHRNTFLFRFSANTALKNIVWNKEYEGATHGDDLPYIFHIHAGYLMGTYNKSLETKDHIYDKFMRTAKVITNFARTGDPSIEGDTPFKSCRSENELYCQELGNELKTHVMNNIKEILHYDVWRDVENFVLHKNDRTGGNANRLSQGFLVYICITLSYLYVFAY